MPALFPSRTVEQPKPSWRTPNGFTLGSVSAYMGGEEFSEV